MLGHLDRYPPPFSALFFPVQKLYQCSIIKQGSIHGRSTGSPGRAFHRITHMPVKSIVSLTDAEKYTHHTYVYIFFVVKKSYDPTRHCGVVYAHVMSCDTTHTR
jgi:hypothetical protein